MDSPAARTKRPTSPAPTPRDAFTLVETLVAMAIAAVTLTVAAMALVTVLTAEQRAALRREALLQRETLQTAWLVHGSETGAAARIESAWIVDANAVEADKRPTDQPWFIWSIQSRSDPAVVTALARRTAGATP